MELRSAKVWADLARGSTREGFTARYPAPFLLVENPAAQAPASASTATTKLQAIPRGATSVDDARAIVHVVMRRPGASSNMITVGRAATNDIVLQGASVSNLHAYLTREQGAWVLRDARSSNGTWHGSARVDGPSPLGEDDLLRFGDVRARFLSPARFHAFLTGQRGGSGPSYAASST